MLSLKLVMISAALAQASVSPSTAVDPNLIVIQEKRLPVKITSQQQFVCVDEVWQVNYTTNMGEQPVSGSIIYFDNGNGRVVNEAHGEVFAKLSIINGFTLTCNQYEKATGSNLLFSGIDKDTEKEVFGWVKFLGEGEVDIYYELLDGE